MAIMKIEECEEGKTQESKIKKVLFGEVNFVLSIISIVGVVIALFYGTSYKVQKQIDDIKNEVNTEQKLSAQMQNLKDNDLHTLGQNDIAMKDEMVEIEKEIVKLQTLIDERIPAK